MISGGGTQLVKAAAGNSTKFFAYALNANPVASTGYNRHFKFLREKILPVPPLAEQEAIAERLHDADSELKQIQARLVKAHAIKTGMMQQLLTGRTRLPAEAMS